MPRAGATVIVDPTEPAAMVTAANWVGPSGRQGFCTGRWDEEQKGWYLDHRWWPFESGGVQTEWVVGA